MKAPIRLNKQVAFMVYVSTEVHEQMKKLSESLEVSMSQIAREAINMRLSSNDQYEAGFASALDHCERLIQDNLAAQMRFPSGKSVAEILSQEINLLRRTK